MTKGKFALGAIVGAVAGVVAGVLTAPKSGKETREDLKAKADSVKKDAELKATEVKAEANKQVKNVQAQVEDYKARGARALHAAKKEADAEFSKKK